MTQRRCIIVAGFPRSGSSWLAKGLSFAPGFTYYREPDTYEFVPGAEERFANLYLTAEHDDPAYRRHLTRAAAGEVATARAPCGRIRDRCSGFSAAPAELSASVTRFCFSVSATSGAGA